jgi:hypothetical protein
VRTTTISPVICGKVWFGCQFSDSITHIPLASIVAQHRYEHRGPSMPFANMIPFESYHRHGKMYVDELDFRTWNVVRNSEVSLLGLSCSMDIAMWKPVIRRGVGRMLAGDMGWWFYDMENGWFDHPAILADVSDMLREIRSIPRPGTGWRPSAAIVIDEINVLENVNLAARAGKTSPRHTATGNPVWTTSTTSFRNSLHQACLRR